MEPRHFHAVTANEINMTDLLYTLHFVLNLMVVILVIISLVSSINGTRQSSTEVDTSGVLTDSSHLAPKEASIVLGLGILYGAFESSIIAGVVESNAFFDALLLFIVLVATTLTWSIFRSATFRTFIMSFWVAVDPIFLTSDYSALLDTSTTFGPWFGVWLYPEAFPYLHAVLLFFSSVLIYVSSKQLPAKSNEHAWG